MDSKGVASAEVIFHSVDMPVQLRLVGAVGLEGSGAGFQAISDDLNAGKVALPQSALVAVG